MIVYATDMSYTYPVHDCTCTLHLLVKVLVIQHTVTALKPPHHFHTSAISPELSMNLTIQYRNMIFKAKGSLAKYNLEKVKTPSWT